MNKLQNQLLKARHSSWNLWLLNWGLWRMVPFNRPHRLKITEITDHGLTISARNIRSNQNHIRGIHACLLATLCEYASGLCLLSQLSPEDYRIILKSIRMTYHYQAKQNVEVTFVITPEQMEEWILAPLKKEDKVFHEFAVEVYDTDKHHICTGNVNWQIKSWKNVKTKF